MAPEAVGLCGSDFHYFLGDIGTIEDPSALYPRIQGHEAAATIVELGADCPPHLETGMRVAIWPVAACGHCYPCRIGRGNACVSLWLTGIHADGALQERLVLPSSQVFPVGDLDAALTALDRAGLDRRARRRTRTHRAGRARRDPRSRPDRPGSRAGGGRPRRVGVARRPGRESPRSWSRRRRRAPRTSRQTTISPPPSASGPVATGRRSSSRRPACPLSCRRPSSWWRRPVEWSWSGLSSEPAPVRVGDLPFRELDVLGVELLRLGRLRGGSRPRRETAGRRSGARHPRVRSGAGARGHACTRWSTRTRS